MFICEMCQRPVPAGFKQINLVVKERRKKYPSRRTYTNKLITDAKTNIKKAHYKDDPGGEGVEAAVVKKVCSACAASFNKAKDAGHSDSLNK